MTREAELARLEQPGPMVSLRTFVLVAGSMALLIALLFVLLAVRWSRDSDSVGDPFKGTVTHLDDNTRLVAVQFDSGELISGLLASRGVPAVGDRITGTYVEGTIVVDTDDVAPKDVAP
jgi:hypothetical protein